MNSYSMMIYFRGKINFAIVAKVQRAILESGGYITNFHAPTEELADIQATTPPWGLQNALSCLLDDEMVRTYYVVNSKV